MAYRQLLPMGTNSWGQVLIHRLLYFTWPIFRNIFLTLMLCAILLQIYLYLNRDALFSTFTPVTEGQLYCVNPQITEFDHIGDGHIKIKFEGINKTLSLKNTSDIELTKIINHGNYWSVDTTLQEGFNEFKFHIDGNEETWNVMFTPKKFYEESNSLSSSLDGVIGLYPSSICMGKSVLASYEWSPILPISDKSSNIKTTPVSLKDDWNQTFIESIQKLEGVRGTPDQIIETADITEVVKRLDEKTSHGWCSQIALYTVAKLDGLIPVRLLGSAGLWNSDISVRTGGHTFLEYVDPKTNRWAISDPTNYIFAIRDKHELPLNALELNRVLSLPSNIGSDLLMFDIVNPVTNKISVKEFDQLHPEIQRDLKFYFRPMNSITYYSGNSSIYSRTILAKIQDWTQKNRRFVFQSKQPSISVASVRVLSFWLFITSLFIIIICETIWHFQIRKRFASKTSIPKKPIY
jgi:hypothetical protein